MSSSDWNQVTGLLNLVLAVIMAYELFKIYMMTRQWHWLSLMLLPVSLLFLYFWITFSNPLSVVSKNVTRFIIIFDLANALYVLHTYYMKKRDEIKLLKKEFEEESNG